MPAPQAPFDRKLAAIFQAEATGHVERMQQCLAQLAGGAPPEQPLTLLFRATHSLKGAARAVGQDAIELACHAAESLLAALQRGALAWSPAIADALDDLAHGVAQSLGRPGSAAGPLAALLPRLERLAQGESVPPLPAAAPAAPLPTPSPVAPPAHAVDAAAPPEQTVRIGVERLGQLLYQVEELVAAKLHAGHHVQQLRELLAAASAPARDWRSQQAQLRALATTAAREQRQLAGAVDTLLADVKRTLLLPAGAIRPFLAAAVRELSRSQGKELELRITGDEVEIDRRVLDELREPLVHLVRNAAAHGIEPPQARRAAGKPERGLIAIDIASRPGGRVEITVADDGAGVDTERLAAVARELALPVPEDGSPEALLPLVFGQGVSTAPALTHVAGRGIGLAIVRDTIERLGGTIAVQSERGQGTTFRIVLALSLANYRAIEVQAAGRSFLLPTARVERCLRFTPAQVRRVGQQQAVPVGEQDLPLASLAAVLGLPAAAEATERISCLVVAAGERRIALAVDEVRGEQEVLGKPVDNTWVHSPVVAGAAVLATGEAAPILNASELVRMVLREGGRGLAPAPVVARARGRAVLVAEDSITSRTLLKNILELAGYRVEVAVDGAEALDKLRAGAFDIVVSDIEMPRLDGIGLTQAIRGDPALAALPVILVTSLASPADRERGAEAGANAYIVKSGFDQGNLLQAVAEFS